MLVIPLESASASPITIESAATAAAVPGTPIAKGEFLQVQISLPILDVSYRNYF